MTVNGKPERNQITTKLRQMKKHIVLTGIGFLLATGATLRADDMNNNPSYDDTDLYRANELSLEGFGGATLGEHTIDHLSGDRVRHNGRLGLGAGVNYFFTRYIGVEGEGYSENPDHSFVDNAGGSLVLRLPLEHSGFAPYIFGGGGHLFDPVVGSFLHAGAGIEYRFTRNLGAFADARYVWTDRIGNYGLGRAGFRFVF
jgi:hypothetical protein